MFESYSVGHFTQRSGCLQRLGRRTGCGASERHHRQGSPRPSPPTPPQAPGRPTPRCYDGLTTNSVRALGP